MNKWDVHFMRIAREASRMSKDPSTQVGAVLVKDRRVIGTGFNGFPPYVADDHRLFDRDAKMRLIVHAEMNAIIHAGRDAQGSTLYMYGFSSSPCINCSKHVLTAGVKRVVSCGPDIPDRWKGELAEAEALLGEGGVFVNIMSLEELDY